MPGLSISLICLGSSPRMRGTRYPSRSCDCACGIIPAYAGNTVHGVSHLIPIGDHPRVCGEHMSVLSTSAFGTGSSPRMRGTPLNGRGAEPLAGIIPAYAGNTFNIMMCHWNLRDHPRVCGEHDLIRNLTSYYGGSSPRMRGTPVSRLRFYRIRGIIPAYAGNTGWPSYRAMAMRDHPRVCGEHPLGMVYSQ